MSMESYQQNDHLLPGTPSKTKDTVNHNQKYTAIAAGCAVLLCCMAVVSLQSDNETTMLENDSTIRAALGPKVPSMIDAGSTGCKLYTQGKDSSKVEAECNPKAPIHGLAILAKKTSECHGWVGESANTIVGATTGAAAADFAGKLMKELKRVNNDPSNADKIPMMATAGMRLLPQTANDNIWAGVRGKGAEGLKIIDSTTFARTLPGTVEAYYEWLSNAINNPHSGTAVTQQGTFTMGGASAQIAVPLTSSMRTDWTTLTTEVTSGIDCDKLLLPDFPPEKAPTFNTGSAGVPAIKKCVKDYIDFIPTTDPTWPASVAKTGIEGLGVVSFLGLLGYKGSGNLFAGGAIQMDNWAAQTYTPNKRGGCKGTDWENCSKQIENNLDADPIFGPVSKAFRQGKFGSLTWFNYNTPASQPTKAGIGGVTDEAHPFQSATTLKQKLNTQCGSTPHHKNLFSTEGQQAFGHGQTGSCSKAFWTALYVLKFFSADGKISADKNIDWSAGGMKVAFGSGAELLQTPISSKEFSWMHGAMAHYEHEQSMQLNKDDETVEMELSQPWMRLLAPATKY